MIRHIRGHPNIHSTYLRGSESASIEVRPQFINLSKTVSYEVNLTLQQLEVLLISKFWPTTFHCSYNFQYYFSNQMIFGTC